MSTNFNSGEQKLFSDNKITNKGNVIFIFVGGFGFFFIFLLLVGMIAFGIIDVHHFGYFMMDLFTGTMTYVKIVVIGGTAIAGAWFVQHKMVMPWLARSKKIHFANDNFAIYEEAGTLRFHDHKDERNTYNWRGEIGASDHLMLPSPDDLPHAIKYDDIRGNIPRGHTLLGVDRGKRLQTRPFSVLDTCWICGGSKTGKTNTASLKVDEAYQMGCKFIVCDPHRNKPDGLTSAIAGYSDAFLTPSASTFEEIEQALRTFLAEARRRIAGGRYSETWILIVDEVGSLTGDKGKTDDQKKFFQLLYNIARMCGQELRGFGMAGWFISQNAVGLSWLRSFAMTIFTHKLLMENERKVATNNNMTIVKDMDNWPRGRVLVYGLDIPEGQMVLQQPLFTPRIVDADPPTTYIVEDVEDEDDMEPLPMKQYSNVHAQHSFSSSHEQNFMNVLNGMNELVNVHEYPLNIHEQHERFMNIQTVSDEEKAAILAASQTQLRMTGKIVRTKVRDDLGWNNAMFPKIKYVLDEEGL